MATEHELFLPPDDRSASIWRYMDFTKFVWMLEHQALYFSRIDLLGDPFEGSLPASTVLAREEWIAKVAKHSQKQGIEVRTHFQLFTKMGATRMYVNCWHLNIHESAAMWKIYGQHSQAIAIRSSFQKLFDTLPKKSFVGKVLYIDYAKDELSRESLFSPILSKRKSFEHEAEIRCVLNNMEEPEWIGGQPLAKGRIVEMSLKLLIDAVYVSPECDEWFSHLVESVVQRYGFNFPVLHSSMRAAPVF